MAFTPTQLTDAINISGSFSLINGAAVITDITPYSSLGIVSPYTVKILLFIQDSTLNTVYKNPGYDAANFSSPDMQPIAGTGIGFNQFGFTLPQDITGAYLQGQYTFNLKVQVYDGVSVYTDVAKTLYQNVCSCCNGIIPYVTPVISYNPAQVGVTDNTQYGTFVSLANTLTLYPPQNVGAPQSGTFTGSPATLFWLPPTGTLPYTGVWQWKLSSVVTYIDNVTGSNTSCLVTANGNFEVTQNPICKVRCFISNFENRVWETVGCNESAGIQMQKQFTLACGYLSLMSTAIECGAPLTTVNGLADRIYAIIGVTDPDCNCNCNDGTVQQMVSLNSIQGAPGTNGLSFRQGSGAPSAGLGIVGDSYLNNATGDVYLKTGVSTWTLEFNIEGAPGSTGPSTNLIFSGPIVAGKIASVLTTTNGSFETLSSFSTDHTNALKNLVNVGDIIRLYARFEAVNSPNVGSIAVQFLVNGTGIVNVVLDLANLNTANSGAMELMCDVILQDATIGAMKARVNPKAIQYSSVFGIYVLNPANDYVLEAIADIGGATCDFAANNYTFSAQANSVSTGDVRLVLFSGEKLTKS